MLRRLLVLGLVMLVAESIGYAQDRSTAMRLVQTTPGGCELNAAALDSVRNEALEEVRGNGVVIVIARLGNSETSRVHNRRRLLAVKNYLSKYGLTSQRVITAEGERMSGYGRVELYVDGKLRTALLANRNRALCVECCDTNGVEFYPYRRGRRGR